MRSLQKGNKMLYLVPTPIGNLADITYRSVETLLTVDIIYAEDTRSSGILLKHYNIRTPVKSYHKFNEKSRISEIISLLKAGKRVAIISDAGTPGISDPSNILVKSAIDNDICVTALPGATALIPALVSSGFDTGQFMMCGFLPSKESEKARLLKSLSTFSHPIIFYESPHRIEKTLQLLNQYFIDAEVCIGREISKIYETYYRGKLNSINNIVAKGEFVIIIQPSGLREPSVTNEEIYQLYISKYQNEILSKASKQIAEDLGISKNSVYSCLLEQQQSRKGEKHGKPSVRKP